MVDNRIPALKKQYQGGERAGASTLISRSTSEIRVPQRNLRRASEGGPIDPKTGQLVYTPTGKTNWKGEPLQTKIKRGAATTDARTLLSDNGGQPIERVYADHSNRLRALANEARKTYVATEDRPRSPTAARTYAKEVDSLRANLTRALSNAPLERKAQLLANTVLEARKKDHPSFDRDQEKKWRNQALAEMRLRLGAKRHPVTISDREWEAIQAGAVSKTMLNQILDNTDLDRVRELATPRPAVGLTAGQLARARAMVNGGATLAEAAQAIGISSSGLSSALRGV